MSNTLKTRFKRAWNVFINNKDPTQDNSFIYSAASNTYRPDRIGFSRGKDRTIINSIYTRIAIDISTTEIKHVRTDENGRFVEEIKSGLDYCLTTEANIDQTGEAFIRDIVISLLDEGVVAVVPVVYFSEEEYAEAGSMDIKSLRVGKITDWYPYHVRVLLYNEKTGLKQEVLLPKHMVGIIENPFYSVMNEPNSTLQRLIRKLNLLDAVDEQSSSGKLDIIIQFPYTVRSQTKKDLAEERRRAIESQLKGSKYGIAYIDSTEHITQLNRPAENNLLTQIEYLTNNLFGQLGMTPEILNGTASDQAMQNYLKRTVEPIIYAITEELERKFLTKTARTQHQAIMAFTNLFRILPLAQFAETADKLTRNEIMTSNEFRQLIGLKPSKEPNADELRNKNLPAQENQNGSETGQPTESWFPQEDYDSAMAKLDEFDSELNNIQKEFDIGSRTLKHYASKYYDPIKAHEYYERTKQLKGRQSNLNDEGKAAVELVKGEIKTDKQKEINEEKSNTSSEIEKLREENQRKIAEHNNQMQTEIARLRANLSKYSKDAQKRLKIEAEEKIATLRAKNQEERNRLNAEFRSASQALKDRQAQNISGINTKYDEQYQAELEAITSNSAYQKPATSKKSTSSKKAAADDSYEARVARARAKLKEYNASKKK